MEELHKRYKAVWDQTLAKKELSANDVEKSRFYFDFFDGQPIPKKFDTFAIVCCLPFPVEFQKKLNDFWREFMDILDQPLAYGVLPENRHVEIFLFQRPQELFPREIILDAIEKTKNTAKDSKAFSITFKYPFLTPDGTIVVPGYDDPNGAVDLLRESLKTALTSAGLQYPKIQSQWLHTSLGRILQPVSANLFSALTAEINKHANEEIGQVKVTELLFTYEKQWYMVDKEILHRQQLR